MSSSIKGYLLSQSGIVYDGLLKSEHHMAHIYFIQVKIKGRSIKVRVFFGPVWHCRLDTASCNCAVQGIHPWSYPAQRNYKKLCQEKKIKKQKRGVTGVKCWQNNCHWPILLGQWQHRADNTLRIQKWLFNPSIPLVLKPQVRRIQLSSNTCTISHKRIFLMST